MALIPCPECGHQISTKANTCPNCGFDLANMPHKVIRECGTGEYVLECEHKTLQQCQQYIQTIVSDKLYQYSYKSRTNSQYCIMLDDEYIECVKELKNVVRQHDGANILEEDRLTAREATQYKNELEKEHLDRNELMRRAGNVRLVFDCDFIIVDADAPLQYVDNSQNTRTSPNPPKCPHCGSTNISKISTTSRIVSTSIFGLASSKIGKTMQCKKCGYKW